MFGVNPFFVNTETLEIVDRRITKSWEQLFVKRSPNAQTFLYERSANVQTLEIAYDMLIKERCQLESFNYKA